MKKSRRVHAILAAVPLLLVGHELFAQAAPGALPPFGEVKTARVEVSQSYVEGGVALKDVAVPIAETAKRILKRAGLGIADADAADSFQISISTKGEALGAEYDGIGRRFTGASLSGSIAFAGKDSRLEAAFKGTKSPSGILFVQDKPQASYVNASTFMDAFTASDFETAFLDLMLKGLGTAPLLRLIADPDAHLRKLAAIELGTSSGDEVRDALLRAYKDKDPSIRQAAAQSLYSYGYIHLSFAALGDRGPAFNYPIAFSYPIIAPSKDGSRLAVLTSDGGVFTSIDGGTSWASHRFEIEKEDPASSFFYSADGTLITVISCRGSVFTSSDGGDTWKNRAKAGTEQWFSIAASADGSCLAAIDAQLAMSTSSDYGATWRRRKAAGVEKWGDVKISADGRRLVACAFGKDFIMTSSDLGATWTKRVVDADSGIGKWPSSSGHVAVSADGRHIVFAPGTDRIYISSDGGASWKARDYLGGEDLQLHSSDDGKRVAYFSNGRLSISTDGGDTWVQQSDDADSIDAAISFAPDGKRAFMGRNSKILMGTFKDLP
jgi:photosystem II stability/assembly factor-like uncharacterized protein